MGNEQNRKFKTRKAKKKKNDTLRRQWFCVKKEKKEKKERYGVHLWFLNSILLNKC